MNDVIFLEVLRREDLLPGVLQERIKVTLLRAEKVALFMNSSIERALEGDCIEPLRKLLTVMCGSEDFQDDKLRRLAAEMAQQLDKETLLAR